MAQEINPVFFFLKTSIPPSHQTQRLRQTSTLSTKGKRGVPDRRSGTPPLAMPQAAQSLKSQSNNSSTLHPLPHLVQKGFRLRSLQKCHSALKNHR